MECPYIASNNTGEEDVFDMVAALMPLLAKWQEIGTALGLRHSVLEIIEATNSKNTRMCMQGVLVQYVRKSYNCDRFGDPSWMSMAKAVAHTAGGNSEETALAILKHHPAKGTYHVYIPAKIIVGILTTNFDSITNLYHVFIMSLNW